MRDLAAITTPFRADGGVDLDAFEAHMRWLGEVRSDSARIPKEPATAVSDPKSA